MVVRRHFEAMVFTYLAEELRTGDIDISSLAIDEGSSDAPVIRLI